MAVAFASVASATIDYRLCKVMLEAIAHSLEKPDSIVADATRRAGAIGLGVLTPG
jgi:hypothetical protein